MLRCDPYFRHRQRVVEDGQTDDFRFGNVRLLHVLNGFVAGNRNPTERAIGDGFQQRLSLSGFHPCFDEITHGVKIHQFVNLDSCA